MKFEYNYQGNTLSIQKPNQPPQSITKTFLTNWGSPGFILEPESHWITFTIYPDKIRAFYKQIQIPSQESILKFQDTAYYQKDLPKTNPLIFALESTDQVQKINGIWVKKSTNS
jgi:hypothetical protein